MKLPQDDRQPTPLEKAARPLLLLALARNMNAASADPDIEPLIAEAMAGLVEVERDTEQANTRIATAERETVQARDVTRRLAIRSQQMEQLAHTDVLTGLPNRRAFLARWDEERALSEKEGYPIGLMLLDADRFKSVNDSEGHEMGDTVLCAIAASLLLVAGPQDLVARLGGDEFALLTSHAGKGYLERLAARIGEQFQIIATELGVDTTLSIGMVSSEHCSREVMLTEADQALYRSKDAGGNVYRRGGRAHVPA